MTQVGTKVRIGRASEFPDPGRKVIEVSGVEIGVFRRDGVFTAYENICPHMAGPVCQGKIIARVEEIVVADKSSAGMRFSETQTNVVCPWHGYEFDIRTGVHQGNSKIRLRKVELEVVDDEIIVTLPEGTEERVSLARFMKPRTEAAEPA